MSVNTFRLDPSGVLEPARSDPRNHLAPAAFGASLTIGGGQAVGRKTSDSKCYPLNIDASDGTQTFAGFNKYPLGTDASGNVFLVTGGTTGAVTVWSPASMSSPIYTSGVFYPGDVQTAASSGTPTAEVDTGTPTNPTTGDIFTVTTAGGDAASFTVGGTQTAAAVVTGLTNAWNSNPVLKALATPSGSGTFILTGATKGQALNLAFSAVGTGTFPVVITTPAVSAQQAEVDTWTFAGTIATADVYTATITYPGGQTKAVSFTVGATTTAAAVDAGLIAAWNADAQAANYATASGTSTFILTGTVAGNTLNVTIATSGAGTVSKVVTKPAFGQNIADIQTSRPGAYTEPTTGFFVVP